MMVDVKVSHRFGQLNQEDTFFLAEEYTEFYMKIGNNIMLNVVNLLTGHPFRLNTGVRVIPTAAKVVNA